MNAPLPLPAYPRAWKLEPTSNGPGCRTWFYVSRWVSRTRVEFLNGIDGKPVCYRTKPEALTAIEKANASTVRPELKWRHDAPCAPEFHGCAGPYGELE